MVEVQMYESDDDRGLVLTMTRQEFIEILRPPGQPPRMHVISVDDHGELRESSVEMPRDRIVCDCCGEEIGDIVYLATDMESNPRRAYCPACHERYIFPLIRV